MARISRIRQGYRNQTQWTYGQHPPPAGEHGDTVIALNPNRGSNAGSLFIHP
jgi:hypothetical protein